MKVILRDQSISLSSDFKKETGRSKLSVATNTSIKNNLNESSIIYGVVNNLILMIANDIGIEAEFRSHYNQGSAVDITINVDGGNRKRKW